MAVITFDTHQFISRLIDAGFEVKQAEAVSDAFKIAQGETDLASARDLREMELRLEAKIDKVTSDLKVDLIKWMAGSLIAQAAVIATLVKLL
ncbi:MAG: hypothetical protein Q8L15_07370 [Methylobacter sp.]|nr:hypothetical protein [Methylobacter sp.]